jgi:hypothetical protein
VFSTEQRGAHRTIWTPCGAQFGEEFGEVLFSILAVDEQISAPESSHRVYCFRSASLLPPSGDRDLDLHRVKETPTCNLLILGASVAPKASLDIVEQPLTPSSAPSDFQQRSADFKL